VRDVVDFCQLGGLADKQITTLSKGMKQRLCLGRTMIHDPSVLILDEPAAGLDPRARIELREMIARLAEVGKTVLISSHILTELAEICHRVGIIEQGRLLAVGSVAVLAPDSTYGRAMAAAFVDEARKGLFGIARSDARIRARVKPLSREKPNDRKRRRRPNERSSHSGGQNSGGRGGSRGGKQQSRNAPDRTAKASPASETRPENGGAKVSEGSSGSSRRRRRGGRGRGSQGSQERPAGSTAIAADGRDMEAEVDVETVPVPEQAAHAAKFTDELVRAMGFNASVRTEIDGDDVTVHIDGDALGALVGPKGSTIQALEEVVRAAVQHFAGGHSAWMHVDVAGYRERRRQALADFACKIADEVKESGEERAMEPMTAADRKVVHDAIAEIEGVETTSEGEEPRRRVVVLPA
jgi:predicted RNA-binding protein Jag